CRTVVPSPLTRPRSRRPAPFPRDSGHPGGGAHLLTCSPMSTATTARGSLGNLPAEVTSFVGRRQEVAGIRRLLSTNRLVTLTGGGGVGKTRLAQRVGAEMRRAFPDG